MEDVMSETTKMTKSTAKVLSSGQTGESISASGAKASNTEREFTSRKVRRGRESGRWGRE